MRPAHLLASTLLVGGVLVAGLVPKLHGRRAHIPPEGTAAHPVRNAAAAAARAPEVEAIPRFVTETRERSGSTSRSSNEAPSPARKVTRIAAHAATPAPGRAGMIVVRDPESGAFVAPTLEQLRRMGASAPEVSRDPEGLVELRGPNGAVGLDLQGRFQDYATVTIGRNGRKAFGCVQIDGSSAAARDSMRLPAPLEEE